MPLVINALGGGHTETQMRIPIHEQNDFEKADVRGQKLFTCDCVHQVRNELHHR